MVAKQIPEQDRQVTLQQGYTKWVGSNFITTAELLRAFQKNLSFCLVTGSFVTYMNALLFGPSTYWGEEMTLNEDCTLELAASEAAFAVTNLLDAGDADHMDLTMSSQDPGTTTDTSKATKDAPQGGKRDLTRKNLKRIRKRPGAPRWTIWSLEQVEELDTAEGMEGMKSRN